MTEHTPNPGREPLPLDVEQEIDRLCTEFEERWRNGERPRIEDYLLQGRLAAACRTAQGTHRRRG